MRTKAIPKTLMFTALLALVPAGAVLAAQDCSGDSHEAYHRALGGDDPGYQCVQGAWQPSGAAGPSGPVIAADMTCGRDPFEGIWRAFDSGGPAHLCGLMVPDQPSGAKGPAGPIMADEQSNPFYAYEHTFPAAD